MFRRITDFLPNVFDRMNKASIHGESITSPLETRLEGYINKYNLPLSRNYQIDFYEVDYCDPKLKIVIEIDGAKYHCSTKQKAIDTRKTLYLQRNGWKVYRLSGSTVYKNERHVILSIIAKFYKDIVPNSVYREAGEYLILRNSCYTKEEKKELLSRLYNIGS